MNASTRLTAAVLSLAIGGPAVAQPITAVIKLKERVPIEHLAKNVADPASSRFGKFYTPREIRALSAPSASEYRRLLGQLRREGFAISAQSKTHLWISVTADSSLFEKTFGAKFQELGFNRHRSLAKLRMPERLSLIDTVSGLDNTRKARPHYVIARSSSATRGEESLGSISQSTIKSVYHFDPLYKAGWTGKGQHIAIATYDGFMIDDIRDFYSKSQLDPMPTVDQVQFNGAPAYDENSAMETGLDAEFSGMIAPGAQVHVFASAENSDAGELAMFTAILDDNRAKVVNYSWGSCETTLDPQHAKDMDKVLARAVAQGVNILVASGDSGSDSCQDGSTAADWPASSPNVVAVGGTTLHLQSGHLAESAWRGSGGGVSGFWDLPSWQSSFASPYVRRSYPDVSFNGDPNSGESIWVHYHGKPTWMVVGGTSMSAPQWAGFLALVGEARAAKGKDALGFLNPVIYSLSASEKSSMLNDVTSGANGAYSSGSGWDAVTGWGSMQADALLERLAGN